MKKLFVLMCLSVFPVSIFAQSSDLPTTLQLLKKNFEKNAVATPSGRDRTRFKADNFKSCTVTFYFLNNDASVETFVEFAPILSSTGTLNRSTNPTQNDVYIKEADGTLTRNTKLRRTNEIPSSANRAGADGFKYDEVNFASVLTDSISLQSEQTKNRYSLTFATNDVKPEYRIEGKHKIYFNAKQNVMDEIMNNFKKTVELCSSK
jgi:hypothetical protein